MFFLSGKVGSRRKKIQRMKKCLVCGVPGTVHLWNTTYQPCRDRDRDRDNIMVSTRSWRKRYKLTKNNGAADCRPSNKIN